jgi:hypothetical protein
MLRRLFNVAAALSLVVCLAICGIWTRSFYRTDQRTFQTPAAFYQVMSGSGGLVVYRLQPKDGEVRWVRPAVTTSFLGAEIIEGRLARRRPWKLLLLPYWLPAGAAALLPGVWLALRARRELAHRCPVCDAELKSQGQECPVCPASASAAAAADPSAAAPARSAAAAAAALTWNPRPVSYRRAV